MDGEAAALEIDQTARTAEIVQQVAIDMEEIGVLAEVSDDMLVPDLGQQRLAVFFQQHILRFILARILIAKPVPTFAEYARPASVCRLSPSLSRGVLSIV